VFDSVLENADVTVIRFVEVTYQTFQRVGEPPKPPDRPYAFVVLPKSKKTIVLEEGVQEFKGDPPVWKECARLNTHAAVDGLKRQ
jgi:hypothetical protein